MKLLHGQANGNKLAVQQIRKKVEEREALIRRIPEEKRSFIERKVLDKSISMDYIAYTTGVPIYIVKAIRDKSERDRNINLPVERRKANFRIEMQRLKNAIEIKKEMTNMDREIVNAKITKILLDYDDFLEEQDKALIAYSYLKVGEYLKGISFAEDYLQLTEPSISGLTNRISEVLRPIQEKNQKLSTNAIKEEESKGKQKESKKIPEKDRES